MSRQGLSTRYVRTEALSRASQARAAATYRDLAGRALPTDELLALAIECGLTDARMDRGDVVVDGPWGVSALRTTGDIDQTIRYREQCAARRGR